MKWSDVHEEGAIKRIKFCSHIQLSTGEVLPILKFSTAFGRVSVVTPFGLYSLHKKKTSPPKWIYDFEIDMRKFMDLIVDTKNFFFSFMVAFPYEYVDMEGDPIKILNWSFKNNIFYPGFFVELRRRMEKDDVVEFIGVTLPTEKAKKALDEILSDKKVDPKIRGDLAIRTIQEHNKMSIELRARKKDPTSIPNNPFQSKGLIDESDENRKLLQS